MTNDEQAREFAELKKTIATLKADLDRCEQLVEKCNKALQNKGRRK